MCRNKLMPRDKDPECRGLLLRETAAAIEVLALTGRNPESHWIPRSQVGYCRKTKREDGTTENVFTVPEWLLEKKQCWDLVP